MVVEELRRLLPRLETIATETRALAFGLPELDRALPQGGLAFGALHEIAPQDARDLPCAFGFAAAILTRLPRTAPVFFVFASRNLRFSGRPHGHGLNALGLDPARVILIETDHDKQSLWAMEETLHAGVPATVVGIIDKELDLKVSQRLHLAAAASGRLLLLLRPAGAIAASAAMTRWRLRAARAACDRFGLITHACWHVTLERCRNGRPNDWLVEFDHAAHRFSLATQLADHPLPHRTNTQGARRAG
ncbi:MAG TPA: ImuA protein [Pseudolabrys sp.]|nr:ImuA protein [Pseudolabrys sp.]